MRILAGAGSVAVVVMVGAAALPAYLSPHPTSSTVQIVAAGLGVMVPQGLIPTPAASPSPSPIPSQSAAPAKPPAHKASAPIRPVAHTTSTVAIRSTQQALINQDRARYHLAPLAWSSCLYNVARYEAAHLAQPNVAFQHYDGVTRDLACHLGRQVGENIGWYSGGINDSKLNSMFMASPGHRENILGPYHYVATAWAVRSDGRAFIAVEFG